MADRWFQLSRKWRRVLVKWRGCHVRSWGGGLLYSALYPCFTLYLTVTDSNITHKASFDLEHMQKIYQIVFSGTQITRCQTMFCKSPLKGLWVQLPHVQLWVTLCMYWCGFPVALCAQYEKKKPAKMQQQHHLAIVELRPESDFLHLHDQLKMLFNRKMV